MHAFDRNSGIIFYSQVYLNGIACWNSTTRHTPQDFHQLERNNQTMIYPSDLNVSGLNLSLTYSQILFFDELIFHICFRLIKKDIYGSLRIPCRVSFMPNWIQVNIISVFGGHPHVISSKIRYALMYEVSITSAWIKYTEWKNLSGAPKLSNRFDKRSLIFR